MEFPVTRDIGLPGAKMFSIQISLNLEAATQEAFWFHILRRVGHGLCKSVGISPLQDAFMCENAL